MYFDEYFEIRTKKQTICLLKEEKYHHNIYVQYYTKFVLIKHMINNNDWKQRGNDGHVNIRGNPFVFLIQNVITTSLTAFILVVLP